MTATLTDISKSFADFEALGGVDLSVDEGEVHALLGANGSGKSTLSKVLCGVHRPDRGEIRVGATMVTHFEDPPAAVAAGVRVVHQDSPLILSLSVAENYALAHGFPARGALGPINRRALRRRVTAALERLGIPAGPEQMAADLSPAERAMVSLAFALDDIDDGGVEVLVLDEVTAHIPESEAMAFLELVRRVPELGVPVLMVTHRFKEVLTFADRATVLSDGRVVHRGPAKDLGFEELVGYMTAARTGLAATAAEVADEEAAAAAISVEGLRDLWRRDVAPVDPEEPILELVDVSGVQLDGVGFVLRPGEIVGVAGLPESGIGELPTILAGATPRAGGTIRLAGEELPRSLTPAEAIAAGLLSVPRDRHAEGGAASLTLAENMTLPEASRFWHRGRRERGIVGRFLDGFDVRPPRADALFGTLSGGNQQKVVIAKWMIAKPRVLVLDNPTAGVDPAARRQLFEIFHEAAADGLALLVFSSEPEQFAEHCSRVLVLGHGRITGELAAESLAAETINQKVTSLSS